MVAEKEERYEEEGEYHFSDDQVNYDAEPEAPKASSTSFFSKGALLEKFKRHRKGLLGTLSLVVLVSVVYKILIPASTSPATEFSQTGTASKTEKPTEKAVVAKPKDTTSPPAQPVVQSNAVPAASTSAPVMPVQSVENKQAIDGKPTAPAPVVAQQNAAPTVTPVATPTALPSVNPPLNAVPQSPPIVTPPTAGSSSNQVASTAPLATLPPAQPAASVTVQAPPIVDARTKDRITALEQQNTAMMNLLQTEYAQKIADTETQSMAMRGKMEDLTKRINRMEASLNQITQLLRGTGRSQASGVMGNTSSASFNTMGRPAEPRMVYGVQAIIPGRAWLKSESGDTVTVAEGDYLKGYGRVTKIDPYDGIVAIDTGNKVINLSYGVGGD